MVKLGWTSCEDIRLALFSSQKKACCHCGRKRYHSRCLYLHKFSRQETDALLVTEPDQSSENNANLTISANESN